MNNSDDKRAMFGALRKARSVTALCGLLGIEKRQLELLARQPRYKVFHVPKNRDDLRLIEDPSPPLKKIQSTLNAYLQSAYYFEKSHASHGFVVNVRDDDDRRNILSNARKHLRNPWLFQLDLADFFHYVTTDMVRRVFHDPPLCFSDELCELLAGITTYQGRLPMGAPSSPVLSNLACRELDENLLELCAAKFWTYTRYADDFSFSASRAFSADDQYAIRAIIREQGFEINDKKMRLAGPTDEKIVTGILLRGKGELKPGFLQDIEKEVERLAAVVEAQNYQGELHTPWVEKMKQQLRGKIAFAGFVLGVRHPDYIRIKDAYYVAITPPEEDFGAVSWRGFNYLT